VWLDEVEGCGSEIIDGSVEVFCLGISFCSDWICSDDRVPSTPPDCCWLVNVEIEHTSLLAFVVDDSVTGEPV